jgi:hypothetical protein
MAARSERDIDGRSLRGGTRRVQTRGMVKKLLHTRMRVNDIERTVKFYEDRRSN